LISKQVATTAGELSSLFARADNTFGADKMQRDIDIILTRNGIKGEEIEQWWQK